jgi:serine/threonine protein kinase/WD40 repeat protein
VPDPLNRLAEEFVERHRRGERPTPAEYARQYPQLAERIRDLFPALLVMEEFGSVAAPATGSYPGRPTEPPPVPHALGDYRILGEVGRGGMGVVYEAVQESLGRHVALKVLPFHRLTNPVLLERFRREAKAAAQLHHTNIVPVFGVGEHQGAHYYAMQFIRGQSLDVVLGEVRRQRGVPAAGQASGTVGMSLAQGLLTGQFEAGAAAAGAPPAPDEQRPAAPDSRSGLTGGPEADYYRSTAQVGVQVAGALAYAHKQGVLHRDVKPSNLLLDTAGTVWITDFGLAKAEGSDELTSPGDIVGTMRYMAPERFEGRADARSDVYSLGITLYEMLTLRPPFQDSKRDRLIERVLHEEPPRPSKLDPRVPRDLETIVLKAMAKDPADRYPSAQELGEDLGRFLADRPIRARRSSWAERGWRWCRRNPALAALTASVALLLVVVAAGSSAAAVWLAEKRDEAVRAQEDLRHKHAEALAERERADAAERQVSRTRLDAYVSRVSAAHAARFSRQAGQRCDALKLLAEAADVARSLRLDDRQVLELRNDSIACLTLTDIRLRKRWKGWPAGTTALTFDPDFARYARSDARGNISIRRVRDDKELLRLPGPGTHAWILRFSPDGRLLAATYHVRTLFKVWDLARGQAVLTTHTFGSADFSPDGRRVAVDDPSDGSIRLYDLGSGREVKRLATGEAGRGHHLAFHPDGRRLAVARWQPPGVEIRDVDTDAVLAGLPQPAVVHDVQWSPDGKLLAAACADHRAYIWDAAARRQQAMCVAERTTDVRRVAFNHRGDLLATHGWDETLRLWDPFTGRLILSKGPAEVPQFSRDDRTLGLTLDGPNVEVWEVVAGGECRTIRAGDSLWSVDFSPDGGLLAFTDGDGVGLWRPAAGKEVAFVRCFNGGEDNHTFVTFNPADGSLITCGSDGLRRRPVRADGNSPGAPVSVGPAESLGVPPGLFWHACVRPNGRALAAADRGRSRVVVVEMKGKAKRVRNVMHPHVGCVALSPDGRWVAAGPNFEWGPRTRVWDARTGRLARDLPVSGNVNVFFDPAGRWLVTGSREEYCFWEVGSWRPVRTIGRDHAPSVGGLLAFTRDGKVLAVAHSPTQLRLLDAATGRELATLTAAWPPAVRWLAFSPDGGLLAAACGANEGIQLWDLRRIRARLASMGLDWAPPGAAAGRGRKLPVRRPAS